MMKVFVKFLFFFIIMVSISMGCLASPKIREATILRFHPMALDRTHCPTCAGVTRVYVNSASWQGSSCRADAADILSEDEHILSLLLAGWMSGKSFKIEVNDSVKPIDEVCKITAAWIE